jgi:hypothetical protein
VAELQVSAGLATARREAAISCIAASDPFSVHAATRSLADAPAAAALPSQTDPVATPTPADLQRQCIACACNEHAIVWHQNSTITSWAVPGTASVSSSQDGSATGPAMGVVAMGWHGGRVLTLSANAAHIAIWELSGELCYSSLQSVSCV